MINVFRQNVLRVFRNPGRDYNTGTFLDCNGNKRLVGLSSNVSLAQAAFRGITTEYAHRARIFQTLGQLMPKGHKFHRFQFAPGVLKHMGFSINFPDAFYVRMEMRFDKSLIKSACAAETLVSAWTRGVVTVKTINQIIILTVDFDPNNLAIHPSASYALPAENSRVLALIEAKESKVDALAEAITKRAKIKSEIADRILALEKQIAEENKKYTEIVEELNALAKARDIIKGD